MEGGLFKSDLHAELNTKLRIGLAAGCSFTAVSSFIASNMVLVRLLFPSFHF